MDSAAPARTVAATGDAAFPRGDMGTGWGSPITIAQGRRPSGRDVQLLHGVRPATQVQLAYALDGSESRNPIVTGQAAPPLDPRSWNGATMVITTQYPAPAGEPPPGALEVRQELTLDAQGRLTVRTSRRGGDGATNTVVAAYMRR
ncbi:MAG: hypothetical protein IPK85_06880 [Gemmatimonadetes bacterium]|nr:hypothetical protein [Gemmatimonadota bacterium]